MTYICAVNVLWAMGFSLLSFQMQVFYIKNKKHCYYVLVVASGEAACELSKQNGLPQAAATLCLGFQHSPFCAGFQVYVSVTSVM